MNDIKFNDTAPPILQLLEWFVEWQETKRLPVANEMREYGYLSAKRLLEKAHAAIDEAKGEANGSI